jgi:hypothetical protein
VRGKRRGHTRKEERKAWKGRGARCKVRGARCEVRGARREARGARREARGAKQEEIGRTNVRQQGVEGLGIDAQLGALPRVLVDEAEVTDAGCAAEGRRGGGEAVAGAGEALVIHDQIGAWDWVSSHNRISSIIRLVCIVKA